MKTVNIHEAKTHLSRLVEEAAEGKEVVIAKAGRPRARLVPVQTNAKPRVAGFYKGKIRIPKNFDAPMPDEIARAFGAKE
jgi:prevent-host-death family protein